MRYIGRLSTAQKFIKAVAYRFKVSLFHKYACHVRAANCLAEPLIRQHLGLTDFIAKATQSFHNLCKTDPARFTDLFELLLKPGIVYIDVVAKDVDIVLCTTRSEPHSRNDAEAAA
jgi:hypothetical protein